MPTERMGWSQVEALASRAFNIWSGTGDLDWACGAWAHLAAHGLTTASGGLGRLRVHVRLLVLASIYRDWCAIACDEVQDDDPSGWLAAIEVSPFFVGQLVGASFPVDDLDDAPLDEAVFSLMAAEREAVVKATTMGFGGAEGLFVALWRSSHPDVDEEDEEILNTSDPERVAAYQWITEGMPSKGPVRERSEMDY